MPTVQCACRCMIVERLTVEVCEVGAAAEDNSAAHEPFQHRVTRAVGAVLLAIMLRVQVALSHDEGGERTQADDTVQSVVRLGVRRTVEVIAERRCRPATWNECFLYQASCWWQ